MQHLGDSIKFSVFLCVWWEVPGKPHVLGAKSPYKNSNTSNLSCGDIFFFENLKMFKVFHEDCVQG